MVEPTYKDFYPRKNTLDWVFSNRDFEAVLADKDLKKPLSISKCDMMSEENRGTIKYAIVEAMNRTYIWAYTANNPQTLENYTLQLDENRKITNYDVSENIARKVSNFKRKSFQNWLDNREEVDAINIGELHE